MISTTSQELVLGIDCLLDVNRGLKAKIQE